MERTCACPRCSHPVCPPINASPPYYEVLHEHQDNSISVKVPKKKKCIPEGKRLDGNCLDTGSKRCEEGCARVNIVANRAPPEKRPNEDMFSLRTMRQTMPNNDLRKVLEVEFRSPRNYKPLPDLRPPAGPPRKGKKKKRG